MKIGSFELKNRAFLAPMAGVTDQPFRVLCKRFGAGIAVSEMVSAGGFLCQSSKTLLRLKHEAEPDPIVIQIAGADEQRLVNMANLGVNYGAQIIDINMGCPARKVCGVASGSSLMLNEPLVAKLLNVVVKSVDVPVTLKTRLGWDSNHINIMNIARIAEDSGIAALTVHGRTRNQMYRGNVDYDAIAKVKSSIKIPVIANGDIDSAQKASWVLQYTGVDAIMIGRAALGNPWIFNQIEYFLSKNKELEKPNMAQVCSVLLAHLDEIYRFYGEYRGCRIARKHIAWFSSELPESKVFQQNVFKLETTLEQRKSVQKYFSQLV